MIAPPNPQLTELTMHSQPHTDIRSSSRGWRRISQLLVLVAVMALALVGSSHTQPAYAGVVLKPGDFVLVSGRETVHWLEAAGGELQTLTTNHRFGIAALTATGPNSEVYVSDSYFDVDDFTEAGSVVRVNPSNGELAVVSFQGLGFITGLAVGADGTIYTADSFSTGEQINRINPTTGVRTTVLKGGLVRQPYGLAVEADGSVLTTVIVTSDWSGPRQVIRIRAGSNQPQVVSTGGSFVRPKSLTVGPDGSIFVLDEGGNLTLPRILKVHPQTGAQTILTNWPNRQLAALVVDAAGSLYAIGDLTSTFSAQGLHRIDLQTGQPATVRMLGASYTLSSIALVKVASEVVCSPRPPVSVKTSSLGNGRLQVTVTASGSGNTIRTIGFGAARNASIEAQPTINGAEASFVVKRAAPGAATMPFTVVDGCGEWKSFVGGGANAF